MLLSHLPQNPHVDGAGIGGTMGQVGFYNITAVKFTAITQFFIVNTEAQGSGGFVDNKLGEFIDFKFYDESVEILYLSFELSRGHGNNEQSESGRSDGILGRISDKIE